MKYFTSILALCVTLFAQSLRAVSLEYLQYSIKDNTAEKVDAPADGKAALALNTAEKILFVRDKGQTDATYYIAVFELTRSQAANLGWSAAPGFNSAAAFGAISTTLKNPLNDPLAYPTVAQWRAYVEDKIARNCNVDGGDTAGEASMMIEYWQQDYLANGLSYKNVYGLYDTYGNVAEAALNEKGEILFQGGYAGDVQKNFSYIETYIETNETNALDDLAVSLTNIPTNHFSPVAGVRPIYFPPEERTYTVTVKLDGVEVPELTQENKKPGSEITVTPPTPHDGMFLNDLVSITPATLAFENTNASLKFSMPTENVTIDYTSQPYATILVVNGTTSKEKVKAGESFVLTAVPNREVESWVTPFGIIQNQNGNYDVLTTALTEVKKGDTYTYTAVLKPQATLIITNPTETVQTVSKGSKIELTCPERGFKEWEGYGITSDNRYKEKLSLVIGDVKEGETLQITAKLKKKAYITVINGWASIGGTTIDYAYDGERITLSAIVNEPSDKTFSHWEGPLILNNDKETIDVDIKSLIEDNITFTYTAHLKPYTTLEVVNATANATKVFEGKKVTITPANERTFSHWEGDFITQSNKTNNPLTITIGEIEANKPLRITAVSKQQTTLEVINGTPSTSTVYEGDKVIISADERSFSHWEGDFITASNKDINPLSLTIGTFEAGKKLMITAIKKPLATIKVTNGSSSLNNAYKGEEITLTAIVPEGERFSHWSGQFGLTDYNKTLNPLTIKLDQLISDSELTYVAHLKPHTTLEVVDGKANISKVFEGDKVTITPNDKRSFSHWEGDFVTESNKNDQQLTLVIGAFVSGQTLKIKAIKKPLAKITVVNGISSLEEAYKGEEITLIAIVPEGERFSHWSGQFGLTDYNKTLNPLTIKLDQLISDSELTYVAHLKPHTTLEVVDGKASTTKVFEGDKVTITPNDKRSFSHWEGDFVTESNKNDQQLTLIIGAFISGQTLKVKAIKKPLAKITVINGKSSLKEAYKGEEIELTANVPEGKQFSHWTGTYGITDDNQSKQNLTIRLNQFFEDVDVTYTAHYKVAATLEVINGTATPNVTTIYKGDEITITSTYNERSFSHWEGDFVTSVNKENNPITLKIGTVTEGQKITLKSVQKPCATIKVIQGTSSEETVYKGESFTLTATIPEGKAFSHWAGPYGITENNQGRNPLEIDLDNLTKDEVLTYEAHVKDYPRVLVFGGFVELENSVNDRGDGYYNVDARMTITPYDETPKGYEFSHWLKNNQTKITTKDYTFRVEGLGTVNSFVAIYKVAKVSNDEVMHIGAVSEANLSTRTTIGYVASTIETRSYNNNSIKFYDTIEAPEEYAVLDLVKKTISMDAINKNNVANANSEENRLNALVMKRPAGQRYYVGIHEVTNAQYDRVVKGGATPNPENGLYPHTTTNTTRAEADTFMTRLSEMFGLTFEKPTKSQIETISTGAKNHLGYGDTAIAQSMVNSRENSFGSLAPSGAQAVDPYGFYDLWGNAAESLKGDDANLWGGYYNADFQYCNMNSPISAKLMINPGAIRPAITIPERYKVTVTNVNYTTNVLPGQTITLKSQVREGCEFKDWTVISGGKTTVYTSMPQTITINADTTLTANFYDPIEPLTLSYSGDCIGTSSAYPGTTTKIYPTGFGKTLTQISVSPANAAKVNLANNTITFAKNATGTVVITASTQTEEEPSTGKQSKITFDAAGGNGGKTITLNVGSALTALAPSVTREGYTFTGWEPSVPETVPAVDTTYTAQWKINQYTITFNANSGTGGTKVTQDYGSVLTAPTVKREGYTFVGWSPAVPKTTPAKNMTYTAQWIKNTPSEEPGDPEFEDLEKVNIGDLIVTIKSNKATIVGCKPGIEIEGWLDIPEVHNGVNVVAIADNAFQNQTKLVRITFPKTLTSIGKNAFVGCTALDVNKAELPAGFKKLGKGAFTNCKITKQVEAVPGEPIASTKFDEAKGYKLATTTSGVKLNAKTGALTATIKKPGQYDIVLFKAGAQLKMVRIQINNFPKVIIEIEGTDGNCSVKGAGEYLYGKKVTLTAKPSKYRIFSGFYYKNGALFSQGLKASWTMTNENLELIARFKAEVITIDTTAITQTTWRVGQSDTISLPITTETGVKSVKAKLPSGLKLVKTKEGAWQITGAPKKVGDYTATFTVNTLQKQTKTESVKITVMEEVVKYDLSAVQDLVLPVKHLTTGLTIEATASSNIKSIKASKLPSGMKVQKIGDKSWQLAGTPKKAGTYTVTLTITTKAGTKKVETLTIIVTLIPEWAAKTFSGEVTNYCEEGEINGFAQVTLLASGEVKGNVSLTDGAFASLSGTAKLLESTTTKVRLQVTVPWFDLYGKADGKVKTVLVIEDCNGVVTLNYRDSTKGSYVNGTLDAE